MASVSARKRIKPSGGYELWAWYFMRISGLFLVFLVLGHLFVTHVLTSVENVNYYFVVTRWADPYTGVIWRLYDLTMVNLAVFHGFIGLRQVLFEYILRPSRRVITSTIIWTLTVFLIGIGSYAVLMFEEDTDYIEQWKAERATVAAEQGADAPEPPTTPRQP